jgi:hypothetical protein
MGVTAARPLSRRSVLGLASFAAWIRFRAFFRPAGPSRFGAYSHGLRHGLHSFAALRLQPQRRDADSVNSMLRKCPGQIVKDRTLSNG